MASAALVLMMLVVVADVVMRAAFNMPLRGAYDAVGMLLLVMVAFGMGPVIARGGEIVVDLIDHVAGRRGVHALRAIAALMTAAVMLFFAWAALDPAWSAWLYGDHSLELGVPQWILWCVLYLGIIGILWAAAAQILSVLGGRPDAGDDRR
ncbi:MAG: hypothetical protein KatS3mg118_3099 [Paracoccaceae bacterium]|nr:MAG: hypothetical protein KatS3mg118_3099 [Paracoccaceae bacterium]